MTYALNESDCPGTVKRFTVDNKTISNGLDYYTACTTADQTCADLAKSLDNRTNTGNTVEINLSKNICIVVTKRFAIITTGMEK